MVSWSSIRPSSHTLERQRFAPFLCASESVCGFYILYIYISGTPWDQPFKILQSVLRETLFFVQLHPSVLPWLEIQHCQA